MLASRVHKNLLLKVMKVADIFEFTVAQNGDKPVHMVSADGKRYALTKDELCANFTTIKGKPIKLIGLNKNKTYLAAKLQSIPCVAVKLTRNSDKHIKMPDGREVGPGNVIVLPINKIVVNGEYVDMSDGTVMSEAFFRKTCVLKEISPALRKQLLDKDTANKAQVPDFLQPNARPSILNPQPFNLKPGLTPMTPLSESEYAIPANNIAEQERVAAEKARLAEQAKQTAELGTIVGVCKFVNTDIVAGYRVKTGNSSIILDVDQTMQACENGLIGNATTVSRTTSGKKFLRGVGVKLEELPVEFI